MKFLTVLLTFCYLGCATPVSSSSDAVINCWVDPDTGECRCGSSPIIFDLTGEGNEAAATFARQPWAPLVRYLGISRVDSMPGARGVSFHLFERPAPGAAQPPPVDLEPFARFRVPAAPAPATTSDPVGRRSSRPRAAALRRQARMATSDSAFNPRSGHQPITTANPSRRSRP